MIKQEKVGKNGLGVELIRTYSDERFRIKQLETGDIYDEAIDIIDSTFTYEETDELIENEEIAE